MRALAIPFHFYVPLLTTVLGCGVAPRSDAESAPAETVGELASASTAPGSIGWIVLQSTINDIVSHGGANAATLARDYFAHAATYDLAYGDSSSYSQVTVTQDFRSVSDSVGVATVLGASCSAVASNVDAVLVDLEAGQGWPTPAAEQKNPVGAYQKAAKAVSGFNTRCRAGKTPIRMVCTPATDLVDVVSGCAAGSSQFQCFLDLDLAGKIAPSCSIYEIQGQGDEMSSSAYAAYVRAAAGQARAAHAGVVLMAGITISPQRLTNCNAKSLNTAILDTAGTVSGYWLNYSASSCSGTPGAVIATELLSLLKAN